MSDYEIFLLQPNGLKIRTLPNFLSLDIGLVTNGVSVLDLSLPGIEYSIDEFDRNYRLRIERNGILIGNAPFFIKAKEEIIMASGEQRIDLTAFHANYLLSAREVLYYSTSSQSKGSSIPADDLMRRIVRDNLGVDAADSDRDIAAPVDLINVESDMSLASNMSKSFARDNLLEVLREIAEKSREDGLPLYFGIEEDSNANLEFRVRDEQWGVNRLGNVVISPQFENIVNARKKWDWTDEVTVSIALGQSQGSDRKTATQTNTAINAESDFNWSERVVNANQVKPDDTAGLQSEADSWLRANEFKESFTGSIQETESLRFNRDWTWGDKVEAEFLGEQFNVWLNMVNIKIGDSQEDISAKLEAVK